MGIAVFDTEVLEELTGSHSALGPGEYDLKITAPVEYTLTENVGGKWLFTNNDGSVDGTNTVTIKNTPTINILGLNGQPVVGDFVISTSNQALEIVNVPETNDYKIIAFTTEPTPQTAFVALDSDTLTGATRANFANSLSVKNYSDNTLKLELSVGTPELYKRNVYFADETVGAFPAVEEDGWFTIVKYQVDAAQFDENNLPPFTVERYVAIEDPATPGNLFWISEGLVKESGTTEYRTSFTERLEVFWFDFHDRRASLEALRRQRYSLTVDELTSGNADFTVRPGAYADVAAKAGYTRLVGRYVVGAGPTGYDIVIDWKTLNGAYEVIISDSHNQAANTIRWGANRYGAIDNVIAKSAATDPPKPVWTTLTAYTTGDVAIAKAPAGVTETQDNWYVGEAGSDRPNTVTTLNAAEWAEWTWEPLVPSKQDIVVATLADRPDPQTLLSGSIVKVVADPDPTNNGGYTAIGPVDSAATGYSVAASRPKWKLLNAAGTLEPGDYLVDTSGGSFTSLLDGSILGEYEFSDSDFTTEAEALILGTATDQFTDENGVLQNGPLCIQRNGAHFKLVCTAANEYRVVNEPGGGAPKSAYTRLTDGQTLEVGKMYVGADQSVNTPANPSDGDLFYIRNDADLLNTVPGDLPRITLNGPLRTPEGNNITSFTVAPGFEFTPAFSFSQGRWTSDFQAAQVITLQSINSGQELRGNTIYEIEATVANMSFKLPAIPAGAITLRLANGSSFPVTIEQYDTGGSQQLRFENNTIFPSFVIGPENTGQKTDLIGFPFANRWKVYRDWEIDAINNNAKPWEANTAYTTDQIVSQNRLSDGTLVLLQRIADGTSGATYDAAEEALWNEIGLAPVNIPILESLEITAQSYLSSWSQINNVVLSNKADEEIPSIEWAIVDDSDGTAPAGIPLDGVDISPQDVNSTRTIKLQYSGTIQRRGLGAIKATHGHPGSTSRIISVVAKYFNGDTKVWSNTGLGVTGEITDQINEPDGFDFIARAELQPFTEENYGDLPLGTSDAVVDEYYFAVAPSGTNAETEGTTYLVQSKTTTIPNPLTALFWNDPNNLIVVGQGVEVVRIPRLIAVDKVVSTPDPIPSTEVSNSRILYIGNTTDQIYHYDASGAFAGTITDQPQVRWADGALLTDKDTGTEYKYIRGTNKFESLQLLGELPIVRYTADGAIQDIDHRAIFETGAVNMTLSASTIDRVMQMVSEDPITVITADGTEQFTGSLGTSTDSKLTLNETFKWATVIGRTAGGWSQYVGQVGISDGVDISTPTKFKSGTRFVQNGIVAAPSVTFPEAFKVGTIPTIKVLAQDIGDNVNVTLQTVTNTGFTSWVVRNESDVGIGAPIIHWEATGEVS